MSRLSTGLWKFLVLSASLGTLMVTGGLYVVMQLPPGVARDIAGLVVTVVTGTIAVLVAYSLAKKLGWL